MLLCNSQHLLPFYLLKMHHITKVKGVVNSEHQFTLTLISKVSRGFNSYEIFNFLFFVVVCFGKYVLSYFNH